MGRSSKRQSTRYRVGKVSYFQYHGSWYVYYREAGRNVRRRVATDKDEAAAAAAQINAQLATALPTFFSFQPIAIDDLVKLYLDFHEYTARSALGTIDRYRTALRHLQSYSKECGRRGRQAHEINVDALVRYLRELKVSPSGRKRPLRDKGVRFVLETCRSLYTFAHKRRHLPPYSENLFSESASKRNRNWDAKPIFIFDEQTELRFLQVAEGWEFAAHFTMAKTGMRPGEVSHLLVEELDLENGWLHVRNKAEIGWLVKTREERDVPLCDALRAVLRKQIASRKAGLVFVRSQYLPPAEPWTRRRMQREVELRISQAERKQKDTLTRQERAELAESVWRDAGVLKRDGLRRSFLHVAARADLPDMTCPKSWRHTFFSRLSHYIVKLRTKSDARESASIRNTWRSITSGRSSCSSAANLRSSSSGMLLQRKYASLEASLYCLSVAGDSPVAAVWNRNCGDTSTSASVSRSVASSVFNSGKNEA